ncbi:MAG TPA: LppP/LprE family lipoprotein [Mycobacterium sp.]|nr:LppP/LprE family lipoprotein [Mycobacterium sp.]
MIAALASVAGCGLGPAPPPKPSTDTCTDSDGPSLDAVRRAIAAVPPPTRDPGDPETAALSTWTESARGHTRNCRLHWVKLVVTDAMASSPEQLLFFDHDTPLGSPTTNPKPYTTVLSSGEDTVTVQYQWQVGSDPSCCPTGIGTTRFRIDGGKLKAVDSIPDQ